MKAATISLILSVLIVYASAKPTFDVIADIMHDLIHDPSVSHEPPQYNQPVYANTVYGYNERPYQVPSGGFHSHSSPYGYYPNNHHGVYSPSTGAGNYGPNIYDNQGYYKGPPYSNTPQSGYNYDNGHHRYNGY